MCKRHTWKMPVCPKSGALISSCLSSAPGAPMRGLTAIRIRLSGDRDRACLEEPGLVLLWPARCIRALNKDSATVAYAQRWRPEVRKTQPGFLVDAGIVAGNGVT